MLVCVVLQLHARVLAADEIRCLLLVEPHVEDLDRRAVGHYEELVADGDCALLHLALDLQLAVGRSPSLALAAATQISALSAQAQSV